MKRRVNNIPLNSVLGIIPGFQRIIIEDRKACEIYMDNSPNTRKWEGLAKDIYYTPDDIRYKWMLSKVYKLEQTKNGILLVISTQYEEY